MAGSGKRYHLYELSTELEGQAEGRIFVKLATWSSILRHFKNIPSRRNWLIFFHFSKKISFHHSVLPLTGMIDQNIWIWYTTTNLWILGTCHWFWAKNNASLHIRSLTISTVWGETTPCPQSLINFTHIDMMRAAKSKTWAQKCKYFPLKKPKYFIQ